MAPTIENRNGVANQALQQTIHGDVNFHGTTDDWEKEREECLGRLLLNDPKEVKDALKARKGHRVKGTCEWFLNTVELIQWRESKIPHTNVFWLSGNPGTGKSTLAIFLVEAFENDLVAKGDALLAYFFCDTSVHDQNTAVAVLRGLIYQMCRKHVSLLNQYLLPEWRVKRDKILASFDALWSVFFSMATDTSTGPKFFVIDALDECDLDSQRLLLHQLDQCFAQSTSEPSPSNVHFLVTSRPYAEIREMLEQFPHKDMAHFPEVQRDVDSFVREKVARLAQKKKYTSKLQQEVSEILKRKAEGTFLWVGLACAELDKLSAKAGLDRIKGFPSGLTSIYDSLLRRALQEASDSGEDPEMVKWVLHVVAITMEPITLQQLSVACRLHEHEDDEERLLYTENTIDLCRLMVVVDNKHVRLLHKSVKDFLFVQGGEDIETTLQSHARLANRCVDLLIEDYHARQKSTTTDFDDCFVEYSARYWPEHASLAKDQYRVLPHQHEFFSHISPSRDAWLNFSLALREDISLYFSLFHVAARWEILPLVDHMKTETFLNYNNVPSVSKLDDFSADFRRIEGNPLKIAIATGHVETLRRLLSFGVMQVNDRLVFRDGRTVENDLNQESCFAFPLEPDLIMTAVCTSSEMVEVLLAFREHEFTLDQEIVEEAALDGTNGQQLLELVFDNFGGTIQINDRITQAAISNPSVENTMVQFLINKAFESGSSLSIQRTLEALAYFRDLSTIDHLLQSHSNSVHVNLDVMEAVSQNKLHGQEILNRLLDIVPHEAIVVTQELVEHVVLHFDLVTLVRIVDIDNIAVTEDVLALATRNTDCADFTVNILLGQAPDIKITEFVLMAAVTNRTHVSTILPMLLERGLAEAVSASKILEKAIKERSDIYGVVQALMVDYPGLLYHINDDVFHALTIECTSIIDPTPPHDAQSTMIQLLTNSRFQISITATVVEAVAATGTPEEHLLPWLLHSEGSQLEHFVGFWDLPVRKFSISMIQSVLAKMDDPSSAFTSLIMNAIAANRQDIISSFLFERSDISVRDVIFSSATYEAVVCGNLPIMQMLIDHGMRLEDFRLGSKSSLVRAAASSGNVRLLRKLLEMEPDILAPDDAVACPLKAAVASVRGQETCGQMVKLLLEYGANPNVSHHFYGNVLQQAAFSGNLAAVEALLAAGAHVNAQGGKYGSALQAAVCATRQWDEITEVMIKYGADLDCQGGEHGSALYAALFNGRLRLANLLLRQGARLPSHVVNEVLAKASPLKSTLTFVLRQRASVEMRDGLGWSCVHIAIMRFDSFDSTYTMQMLHEAGADLFARGQANRTPLIEASAQGQSRFVQWLLSAGANVHDRDVFGCTPLHYAVQEDSVTARVLVEAGADITATDGYGSSVLHRASSSGQVSNVGWIIDALKRKIEQYPSPACTPQRMISIANFVNELDFLQRSALHLALYGDHMEVVEALLLDGARTNLADERGMTLESWVDAGHLQREVWASLPTSIIPTAAESLTSTYTPLAIVIRTIREYGDTQEFRCHRWLAHCLMVQKQFEEAITALEQCIIPDSGNTRDTVQHYAICDDHDCDGGFIVGIRHRCMICSNCDLCNDCWEKRSFFSNSICCGGHEANFLQIPRPSWNGRESAVINPQGETKDQWLKRLEQCFGTL